MPSCTGVRQYSGLPLGLRSCALRDVDIGSCSSARITAVLRQRVRRRRSVLHPTVLFSGRLARNSAQGLTGLPAKPSAQKTQTPLFLPAFSSDPAHESWVHAKSCG